MWKVTGASLLLVWMGYLVGLLFAVREVALYLAQHTPAGLEWHRSHCCGGRSYRTSRQGKAQSRLSYLTLERTPYPRETS